jgi:DNA-binding response OmpR family regulator
MNNAHFLDQAALLPCDVLVVEDDVMQGEEIAYFLQRSGVSVRTAYDGASALRLAAAHRPRVALLDYNLPDKTGVELAEQLRAFLPQMAIIMMSGRIDGLAEQTLEQLGITVFVNKPLPLAPLRNAVLRLVRSVPSRSEQHHQRCWLSTGVGGTR